MKLGSGEKAALTIELINMLLVIGFLYFVDVLSVLGAGGLLVVWCLFLFSGFSIGRCLDLLFKQLRKP